MRPNTYEKALNRVMAITQEENYDRLSSSVYLFKEYLRRIALWALALDYYTEIFTRWAFFDVALVAAPTMRADEADLETLGHFLTERPRGLWSNNVCRWYLHWAMAEERSGLAAYDLPAPYDPLILLFERSGLSAGLHHGTPQVGVLLLSNNSGNIRAHASPIPIVELDNDILDEIDIREAGRYIGKSKK
jgi:hypothetical protein